MAPQQQQVLRQIMDQRQVTAPEEYLRLEILSLRLLRAINTPMLVTQMDRLLPQVLRHNWDRLLAIALVEYLL
jgi:hypothetical protein